MSWDIYGNPLRAGRCEVHPSVSEPYPCYYCLTERDVECCRSGRCEVCDPSFKWS